MSTSSAPWSTTHATSLELHARSGDWPDGKRRRDRSDLDARAVDARDGGRDEVRVDADRRDRRHARLARVGPDRLRGERGDLAGRVLRPRAWSGPSSGRRARAREAFASFLIERFASDAARSSSATASTEPMRGSLGSSGSSKPPWQNGRLRHCFSVARAKALLSSGAEPRQARSAQAACPRTPPNGYGLLRDLREVDLEVVRLWCRHPSPRQAGPVIS